MRSVVIRFLFVHDVLKVRWDRASYFLLVHVVGVAVLVLFEFSVLLVSELEISQSIPMKCMAISGYLQLEILRNFPFCGRKWQPSNCVSSSGVITKRTNCGHARVWTRVNFL